MASSELLRLVPDAPQALREILDGARGPVEPPIRSEIFGLQRFAQHGRSLGETHRAVRPSARAANFFPRLRGNINTLREAHNYIGVEAETGYDVSPAAEWLLDNFHLIEAQLEEIHAGLPRSYFRTLPVLQDEPLAGLPRIYGVAWAFVAHTDGAFDEELLVQFLSAYQETRELNLAEMWALPTTLRVVLVENLRRLAERVATNKAAREVANLCCDKLENYSLATLDQLLALLNQRGVGRMFLTQMAQRLQDSRRPPDSNSDVHYQAWLLHLLPDFAAALTQQNADQAADNLSVSNAVKSLRAIGDADWPDIVARTSVLMQQMLTSPMFEAEHPNTRDQTLHGIERLARRSGHSEASVAQTLLGLMQTRDSATSVASYWLRGAGRPTLLQALGLHENVAQLWHHITRRAALPTYLGALLLGTVGLVAWMLHQHTTGMELGLLTAALMLFPASEAVVAVINRLISESAHPRHLPRLGLVDGIPPEHRVLVVIPAMLSDTPAILELVHRLHLHYIANPEPQAQFALLSDWGDADTAQRPSDTALLAAATQAINALNQRYPSADGSAPRFILLHRERTFSETEQRWIGWERKRGKLELLVAAMATGVSTAFLYLGRNSQIEEHTPYIVTLDSDTQLPPGRLRELVGVAAHPHNQPRLDSSGRRVIGGYGILQPRVSTPLPARKGFTLYHWLFAGQCGIDPYSAATSEVYQDLFSEGTYTGKGLMHVKAMHAVLSGHLPEGQVLSHDLLEGSLARCAAVTDITVIEDAPFHADVAASRVHRWTRGDWQLLPILLNFSRYPLRAINRWKMFDNLRRSLVAPMSLALLVLTFCSTGLSPWAALLLVVAAFSAGPLMGAVAGFSPSRDDLAKRHFYRQAGSDMARTVWGGLWHLAQLLMQALLAADAIVRALYRMLISHRHLLQWTTAASAQAQAKTELGALVRTHWNLPVVALLLLAALLASGTPHPLLAAALCLLWAASPVWIWWTSRTRRDHEGQVLPAPDVALLDGIARDTWRWFERCIGPEDNYLPPDNLQTLPYDMLAHRTSPTNIGLYLLSVACARQFGWIGTHDLLTRMEATLATLGRLQRHRGHFLNWYDTQSCAPLLPIYVSTVDSGNLCGHLLAAAQACRELTVAPYDTTATRRAISTSRQRLSPLLAMRHSLQPAQRQSLRWMLADHRATRRSAALDVQGRAADGAHAVNQRLLALAQSFEDLAWAADFRFLYHRKRHLLHIGYRVAEQQLDAGFYDLLASESRLTSLLAIAKGDVPVRHWASLGRPFYAIGATAGLRSWSGSMFEYLMPTLVLIEPPGSVLQEACYAALQEQMAYARAHKVPWGISESAYAGQDHTLAYQYAPQGVPRLALRRTPPDELVIAPYSTALAAQIAPHSSANNFIALGKLAAHGRYGFIEALDFTAARQADGEAFTPVVTFMAHHQGMSLVALANVLLDGPAQRWGMANPYIEAVTSLLHERAPREVSLLNNPPAGPPAQKLQSRGPGLLREVIPGDTALEPTHLLSNGRYHVALRSNGAGWSRWGATGITRWRDDALRDAYGSFFYLRRDKDLPLVSITQHPAPDAAAQYQSTYHADRVFFDATWPDVEAHTTVWVSPEDDIEFRQVELRNLGDEPLELELISAFEITLADPRADEAHPAFVNLFVRAEWQATHQALLFERTPRLPTEQGMQAAHFMVDNDPQVVGVRIQTDRQHWLGRNQDISQPVAAFDAAPDAGGPLHTGLDPVCAMAVRLRIAPHGKARLTFATAASDNGGTLQAVIDKYRQHSHVKRSSLMSATLTGIRLRTLGLAPDNFAAIQSLTTALVLSLTRPQTNATRGNKAEVSDRRLLWRFGISGDRPILLVLVSSMEGIGLIRALAQALRQWSWGGVGCDLVVVNSEPASYLMALHREIGILRDRHAADRGTESSPTNLYLLRSDELSPDEVSTLHAQARVRLQADGRPLLYHVQAWAALHEQAFEDRNNTATWAVALAPSPLAVVPAPKGEFIADSGEFRFDVSSQQRTTRPWVNVLANPAFGAHITEAGGGYTWGVNSRLNQVTAWSNDPVGDTPSEWFLLQDRRTLEVWSVAPNAWGDARAVYRVSHCQGSSSIRHRRGDFDVATTWCVDPATSVKQIRLHIINRGQRSLQLRVIAIAEWMMGANRSDRSTVHTSVFQQKQLTAVLCTQRERSAGFGEGTAFLAAAGPAGNAEAPDDWTCDRRECFDARGRLVIPDHFGQKTGAGLDPCAAISTRLDLAEGDSAEQVFLLGYAENPLVAQQVITQAAAVPAAQRVEAVRHNWEQLLGAATVTTPDPLFDAMVNHWLLYQTISCRLWAKSGFYQAGGATGFRDQLQDSMALAWAAPAMLRQQIIVCASRQFPQGDVQHWWHAPNGAGVRTHFSDDLLWLPHAVAHYLRSTGDATLLDESVPFLEGAAIPEGAEDAYYTPSISADEASVYEHAARTLDRSLAVGSHGLPLMGSGDWNDGMNRVGIEGHGESVWLAWFLCQLVTDFAPVAAGRGDHERAERWQQAAEGWKQALIGPAWDGQWFKRAFFDNGDALGSHLNPEAQIDLIAQAWSVLSKAAPVALQRMALTAVEQHLVDPAAGLIKLLDPPLAHAVPSAGYIQAYPPGVRENGGQYSHAGVWAMMAQAEFAKSQPGASDAADAAYRYFTYLSPAHRANNPAHSAAYGIEPYVMAGDVYTQPPYVGRGGWSWYTGSAAWMHRAALESIFGLQQRADELKFNPCLPSHWPKAELSLRRDDRTMRFILVRGTDDAALAATSQWGAQLLRVDESVFWEKLPAQSCFVIPI
ncbi:GH36-type glycosyl hydrolase domain-containing protein [Rhodoferax sp.]|uniref:GH36-type glycosyl hydrolase domain-containing protein n=1 Tax=Rhodoferax sp. TaxID=50421 RepID=UPI00374D4BD9